MLQITRGYTIPPSMDILPRVYVYFFCFLAGRWTVQIDDLVQAQESAQDDDPITKRGVAFVASSGRGWPLECKRPHIYIILYRYAENSESCFFPFLLVPIWILQIFRSFNGGPPCRFPSEGGKRMNVKSEKRKKRLNSRCGSAEISPETCAEISPEIGVNIFQWWLRGVHENLQAVLYRLYALVGLCG